jgi:hypothetical protein
MDSSLNVALTALPDVVDRLLALRFPCQFPRRNADRARPTFCNPPISRLFFLLHKQPKDLLSGRSVRTADFA